MAQWSHLDELEDFVTKRIVEDGASHKELSKELQDMYPESIGISERSIRRFCASKNIHRTSRLQKEVLQQAVALGVSQAGPTYGRKTMCGFLRAQGIKASETLVGQALQDVRPDYHRLRVTRSEAALNPQPYRAAYFGEKLHIDQNEKLVMFGVTHICAIDGYSGKIVGFVSMPVKNNVEIYKHLFRPILIEYGLFDQVRVDHGKEWTLCLFVQETLAHMRYNREKPPHRQTSSTLNHRVERCWPEVNHRVNYPIKSCLIQMQERGAFDLDSMVHKYCVSWITLRVCAIGNQQFTGAWNCHYIPGRGIPNERTSNSKAVILSHETIPEAETVVANFRSMGGHITMESQFGCDPLAGRQDHLAERARQFEQQYSDLSPIFHNITNGDCKPFEDCVQLYIRLTETLSSI